ncbi:TonB-dependent receptor plug domain-containing protein [Prosthecochloris vibrioformis]|uniref:TonB-dependent receptor n=1 Tax=Prosthecochloris vibrioformis TaxID=1098 RepID=A0A5C4RZM7_PROVB|nr:TonB-dependent receptor [Prosthecochloris vibrioformis]TNJ36141.1 TonB-dependent receptor [Prosthecochloris vibrioformis]
MLQKQTLKRLRLLSALLILAPSSLQAAETGEIPWMSMDEVTVTATKSQKGVAAAPVSVEIVTEEEIQNLGATSLREIFEQTPGVFVNPGLGEMSVRGAGAFGTLVLIDGRRIAGERSFKYELNRLGAGAIERIEIVKGPMSVLYGSEAIGGVINIITKKPTEGIKGSLNVRGGSNFDGGGERYSVDGNIRGSVDNLRYSGYFNVMSTQPYTEREVAKTMVFNNPATDDKTKVAPSKSAITKDDDIADSYVSNTTYQDDADMVNLGGTLEYGLTDNLEIGADVSYMHEERTRQFIGAQYPTSYGFPVFNLPIDEELENDRWDVAGRIGWQVADNLELKWKSYGSWYEKRDVLSPVEYLVLGYAERPDGGGSCHGKVTTLSHELNAHWDAGHGHEVLVGGEFLEAKRESPWFDADRVNTEITQITRSLFAQDEWSLGDRLDLVYGLRYDSYSDIDDQATGSIGAKYEFSEGAKLRLNYGQGYRAASGPELFMNRNTPKGRLLGAKTVDADLGKVAADIEPEKSDNIELGMSGRGERWKYDLSAFYNNIDDRIGQVSKGGYYTFENVGDARIQGIDAYVGYRLSRSLGLNAAATVMDAENRTTGNRLDYTPETTMSFSADYRPVSNVLLTGAVYHTGDQTYEKNAQRFVADAYTFVNVKMSWMPSAIPGGELYAGVDNLFDDSVDKELGSTVGTFGYMGLRYMF